MFLHTNSNDIASATNLSSTDVANIVCPTSWERVGYYANINPSTLLDIIAEGFPWLVLLSILSLVLLIYVVLIALSLTFPGPYQLSWVKRCFSEKWGYYVVKNTNVLVKLGESSRKATLIFFLFMLILVDSTLIYGMLVIWSFLR